jgi:putative ABC transport system permease protein
LTNIQVKFQAAHVLDLKDDLTKAWKAVAPEWPLEFIFLDERVDQAYRAETRSLKLFSVFTVIAILLLCLGIYGLSAFSVQCRLREVGIRKVFGTDVLQILKILSWSYMFIVLISFLLGSPMAFMAMNNWLKNYVYKI